MLNKRSPVFLKDGIILNGNLLVKRQGDNIKLFKKVIFIDNL